ncbi:hypothetical protein KSS87_013729 [Heliosperma pusillum]|nr:hypothetical protein KSS87_013729 [Heliosperma pusillum]
MEYKILAIIYKGDCYSIMDYTMCQAAFVKYQFQVDEPEGIIL